MKVVLNKNISEDNIISRSNFIINDILPVAIKKITDDSYKILFICHQDNNHETCFIAVMFNPEKDEEIHFLEDHKINISNFTYEAKLKYLNTIANMNTENGFNTDLVFHQNKDYPLYMYCTGYSKVDDKGHYRVRTLYFTRDNFIKTNIFINLFFDCKNMFEIFVNKSFNNLSFDNINKAEYLNMARVEKSNIGLFHYELSSSNNIYPITIIKKAGNKHFSEISLNDYNQKYYNDYKLDKINGVKCDDIFYIPYKLINGKRTVLCIPKSIMIIFEGEQEV